jgi:hypothetical protein
MTFGVGSAMANRAVDAVMGPRTVHVEHSNAPAAPAAPAAGTWVVQCVVRGGLVFNQGLKLGTLCVPVV